MYLRYQHKNPTCEFAQKLEQFGLPRELLNRYELLVKLNWLRPALHVPIEPAWFRNWRNYPQHPADLVDNSPHWAWAYEIYWFINEQEIGRDEWFLHPYFQSTGEGAEFVKHAQRFPDHANASTIEHEQDIKLVPAYDFFFEWQLHTTSWFGIRKNSRKSISIGMLILRLGRNEQRRSHGSRITSHSTELLNNMN
jgi:hypothetical protein